MPISQDSYLRVKVFNDKKHLSNTDLDDYLRANHPDYQYELTSENLAETSAGPLSIKIKVDPYLTMSSNLLTDDDYFQLSDNLHIIVKNTPEFIEGSKTLDQKANYVDNFRSFDVYLPDYISLKLTDYDKKYITSRLEGGYNIYSFDPTLISDSKGKLKEIQKEISGYPILVKSSAIDDMNFGPVISFPIFVEFKFDYIVNHPVNFKVNYDLSSTKLKELDKIRDILFTFGWAGTNNMVADLDSDSLKFTG